MSHDLQICKFLIQDMSDYITYKAPELYMGSAELTPATDMFAVGCIFAEMVTRKPLFRHSGNGTEINSIFKYDLLCVRAFFRFEVSLSSYASLSWIQSFRYTNPRKLARRDQTVSATFAVRQD